MNNRERKVERKVLRYLKKIVILILVIGFTYIWLRVPDDSDSDLGENNASEQSK